MEKEAARISLVDAGISMSEFEKGSYYGVGTVGVWVEIEARARHASSGAVGVRWTIDGWNSHHDAVGVCIHEGPGEARWRVEIPHLVSIGWRDGSIGGPNGEQPSAKVWTLWGPDRQSVRCLPWGSRVPAFEFALFIRNGNVTHWNNNQGRNFRMDLALYGRKMESQTTKEGL